MPRQLGRISRAVALSSNLAQAQLRGRYRVAGRRLHLEFLEDRRQLSAAPIVDLNGPLPGIDFAVERANQNGLVSLGSHELRVDPAAGQFAGATLSIADPLAGDRLGVLTHGSNITQTYADGILILSGIDTAAAYQQVLRTARFNSTDVRPVGSSVDVSVVVNDGVLDSAAAHSTVDVIEQGTGTVVGNYLFYNNSSYDGHDLAANAADDLAIAPDKQGLPFDQTAASSNYSSYSRGLNGIMIDVAGAQGTITAEDFIFQVGNNNRPDTWGEAPLPSAVVTRAGAGAGGSDRVEITWADGAITNQWLEIVVAANRHTGLARPDTIYFGNSVGETGNSALNARVTGIDALLVVNRLISGPRAAAIDDPLDFDRDGHVRALDALLVVNHLIANPPDLQLVNIASIPTDQLNITTSTLTTVIWQFPISIVQPLPVYLDTSASGPVAPSAAPAALPSSALSPRAVDAALAASEDSLDSSADEGPSCDEAPDGVATADDSLNPRA